MMHGQTNIAWVVNLFCLSPHECLHCSLITITLNTFVPFQYYSSNLLLFVIVSVIFDTIWYNYLISEFCPSSSVLNCGECFWSCTCFHLNTSQNCRLLQIPSSGLQFWYNPELLAAAHTYTSNSIRIRDLGVEVTWICVGNRSGWLSSWSLYKRPWMFRNAWILQTLGKCFAKRTHGWISTVLKCRH